MHVIGRMLVVGVLTGVTTVQAGPLTAALHGSLSGTVENSAGGLVAPSGAVYATISANDNAGSISATLEGSAATTGALGLGLQFTAQYDPATGDFNGLYSDTPGVTPSLPLRLRNTGGLGWSASLSGTAPSSSGERRYTLELQLQADPAALFAQASLPAANAFSGMLQRQVNLSLAVNQPALQAVQSLPMEMQFEGRWNASLVPDSAGGTRLSGQASGSFRTLQSAPLTVVPSSGALSVPVSIGGNFQGSLFAVSPTEFAFKGAWVSQNNPALGGDISISVPLQDLSRFPFSLNGTAQISTGASQLPTLSLPFSASSDFPLALTSSGSGSGSGGGSGGSGAEPPASAVKIKHLGVNLGPYDATTNRAGDFMFTRENMSFNLLFFNFGFVVPANSVGPEKVNPQPTFILPMGTKVHALIDGEVVSITKLYSNDYSVMLKGPGSDLIFELEHVINVTVAVGDQVRAGDVVAEVSGYDAHNYAGMGLVEIGILNAVGGGTPTHLCPFDYLDESIRATTLQNISALQQAWETYRGDSNLYDQAAEVIAGCYRRTPVEG